MEVEFKDLTVENYKVLTSILYLSGIALVYKYGEMRLFPSVKSCLFLSLQESKKAFVQLRYSTFL